MVPAPLMQRFAVQVLNTSDSLQLLESLAANNGYAVEKTDFCSKIQHKKMAVHLLVCASTRATMKPNDAPLLSIESNPLPLIRLDAECNVQQPQNQLAFGLARGDHPHQLCPYSVKTDVASTVCTQSKGGLRDLK